ncbi:MAG: hypothetical protein IIA59_00685 [Candidatus Marinimicrobia bacterium]|nr:hypothetical protein [Candidatus Neomarinimicrobiota bacterium]
MSSTFRAQAAITGIVVPLVRLLFDGGANYLGLTLEGSSMELAGDNYLGLLTAWPAGNGGLNVKTFAPLVSNARLPINNGKIHETQRASDWFEDGGNASGFHNRVAEIRLWTPGITTWADCFRQFYGKVRDVKPGLGVMNVLLQDDSEGTLSQLTLPRSQVNLTDHPDAPSFELGKYVPICIGAIDRAPGVFTKGDVSGGIGQRVQFDDVAYAPDGLHSFITETVYGQTFGPLYVATGDAVNQEANINETDEKANCRIRLNASAASTFTIRIIPAPIGEDGWTAANPENAIDGNTATSTVENSLGNYDKTLEIIVPHPGEKLAGKTASTYALCRVKAALDAVSVGTLTITLEGNILTVNVVQETVANSSTEFNNIDGPDGLTDKQLSSSHFLDDWQFTYRAKVINNPSPKQATSTLYELTIYATLVSGSGALEWKWLVNLKGRKDDGSGTYTGSAGALIENPADVMRQILANDCAVANIDTAAFTTARTARSGWKYAFSYGINDSATARKLFTKWGQDALMAIFYNLDNELTIKAIADTYSDSDVDRTLDWKVLERLGKIVPGRTSIEDIITKVVVNYNWNYVSGNYASQVTAESTTMQTKYNVTAAETTLTLDLPEVRHTTTAQNIADRILKWRQQPHNLLEVPLPVEDWDLAPGDVYKLTNVDGKAAGLGEDVTVEVTRAGQPIYPYWWIYQTPWGGGAKTAKAIQLHKTT